MKEYGGYIEFETNHGAMLHEDAIALNCGRGALEYLCRAKNIEKLFLPYFLCSSVPDLCDKINIEYEYYHIDKDFCPIFDKRLKENEWLYIVNFYGQLDDELIKSWKEKYETIIIDNAQSYYQNPVEGVDTLYTCRKYFGVPDGAFLYTDKQLNRELPVDESFDRMHFLLGRFERSASEFYSEYTNNNKLFATEPVKKMSRLTENLLRGIDYCNIAKKRQKNFQYLHEGLKNVNKLKLKIIPYGAFMYPLWIDKGREIRKELQKKKIYIPTLWPKVLEICDETMLEYEFAADILPVPVDQRYDKEDMRYLVEVLTDVSTKRT